MRRSLVLACLCGTLLTASAPAESSPAGLAGTARVLGGLDTSTEYAQQIDAGWKQLVQPNLEHMRAWWKGRGPETYSTVFYPFSGPDIANALAFFPDADTYLMFGLEAPGTIPDLRSLDDAAIDAGLTELGRSLSTLLKVNYFFTKAMEKKLGTGSFNSVSSLLLALLARSDCEVTAARSISVGARIPGVEITFRRGRGKSQTLRYFMVNVEDAQLAKGSADFLPYLKKQGRFVTMIKSASYLMHREGIRETARFDTMRALILAQSDFVVQDDSGVPLRLFSRDTWKLRFHGTYQAPTTEFGKFLQKDLRVEMQRNSTGKLPFSYGYAFKQGESNLMTAERAR